MENDEAEDSKLAAFYAAKATPEKLEELRAEHVRMYEKRLAWGRPPVDVAETERLLSLWKTLPATYAEASPEQQNEIIDALCME